MIRSCNHEFTQFSIQVAFGARSAMHCNVWLCPFRISFIFISALCSFKTSSHFCTFMTCLVGNVFYFGHCPLWLCVSLLPFPLSRIDLSWNTFCPVCMLMHDMKDKMVLNFGEHLPLQGLSPNRFSKRVWPNNSLMPILRERINQSQLLLEHFTHIQCETQYNERQRNDRHDRKQ